MTLNDAQRQALADDGELEITLNEDYGALAGTKITLKNVDTDALGYNAGGAVNNPAAGVAATGTKTGQLTTVQKTSAVTASTSGQTTLTGIDTTGNTGVFEIAGLKAADGSQVTFTITGQSTATSNAFNDGNKTVSFAAELEAGKDGSAPTYTLYAVAADGGKYSIATGWDGKTGTLNDIVKDHTVTHVSGGTADANFAADVQQLLVAGGGGALGGALAVDKDIDLASSLATGNVFAGGVSPDPLAAGDLKISIAAPVTVATNIYGTTGQADLGGNLAIDFGTDFDFTALLNSTSKENALKLYNAFSTDSMEVKSTLTNNADGTISVKLDFGDGTTDDLASTTFTIPASDLDADTGNTTGQKTLTSGPLAGLKYSITGGVSKSSLAFTGDASNALGTAPAPIATEVGQNIVTVNTAASVTSMNVYAGNFKSGAAQVFTMDYLRDDANAAITLSVHNGDTNGLAAGNALIGKSVSFGVRMNAGEDADDPTFSLVATVDGKEFILTNSWDGTDGAIATDKDSAFAINGIEAGDEKDVAVLNALMDLTYTTNLEIDTDASNTQYAAATGRTDKLFDSVASKEKLTTDPVTVAENLYNTKAGNNDGKLEIKFDKFDLDQLDRNGANMTAIVNALKAGELTVKANIVNLVDSNNAPNGKFTVTLTLADENGNDIHQIGSFSSDDMKLDVNGETVDKDGKTGTDDTAGGWMTPDNPNSPLNGLKIRMTNDDQKDLGEFTNSATAMPTTPVDAAKLADSAKAEAVASTEVAESDVVVVGATTSTSAISQTGGLGEARESGTVAIFNNTLEEGTGKVVTGVSGVTITEEGAQSIMYGNNTDGQGRIYVKFLDDNSFELYKDSSLSKESLVASGRNGEEIKEANNSGLSGFTLDLQGTGLASKTGVYLSLAGIEGQNGVAYSQDVVNAGTNFEGKGMFDADKTLLSGVELGKNTSEDGQLFFKNVYTVNEDTGEATIQVFAYKHKDLKDEDMVAKSTTYTVGNVDEDGNFTPASDADALTVVLNEIRNADNTVGTGLGIVLSVDESAFSGSSFELARGKTTTLNGNLTFTNLGARIFAKDYGSDGMIKVTQDKGAIFTQYGTNGDNSSKRLIDAGSDGVAVEVRGQDATLSVNGMQVKTDGLRLKMATQDIQADLTFNQGKVGSTTLAQVGYGDGSIFTKIGALNLGTSDKITSGDYEGLSGLIANAGHVTSEKINNFSNGMQLQLGEGAGDQNRTVVAIKSMTSENLGRVTKGGYWETGSAVYENKIFTMKDIMGGGQASLKQNATLAMEIIDQAISDVAETRAVIGAFQSNLLQTNSNNLSVTIENITKTESGIRDADMADEMAEFTKQQVLQSAAMSMMGQANQASQNVLQLLR